VLGEHMELDNLCELRRGYRVVSRNEYALFGEIIHDNEDGSKSGGRRELFDEVHPDEVPGFLGNRELLE
jgi:DUF1365 family protein